MLLRKLPSCRPQCCVAPLAVAAEHMRFLPEIWSQCSKLFERYQCMVTKNKRIWALAKPKHQNAKYSSPCLCPEIGNRKVAVMREEAFARTRTQQLSFPTVSRLLELKERESFKSFTNQRKSIVNGLLRKSTHSMYSRLSKKQPPAKKEPSRILTDAERAKRQEWWKNLARPKIIKDNYEEKKGKTVKVEKAERQRRQFKRFSYMDKRKHGDILLKRYKNLAKPKKYVTEEPKKWLLTDKLRFYTPSERILKISQPHHYYEMYDPEEMFRVRGNALKYKASERIKELAAPHIYQYKSEVKEAPFSTNPHALKARVSERVVQLATPKQYSDVHIRGNPFGVSPRALHAKITPRLKELAKPKTYVSH